MRHYSSQTSREGGRPATSQRENPAGTRGGAEPASSRRSAGAGTDPLRIQTKLTVNNPGDRYEQEADRVAEKVMRMSAAQIQRKCAACEKEENGKPETLMRAPSATAEGGTEAPAQVHDVLGKEGAPLDSGIRSFMEPRFGADFSNVRVHTDAQAAESARAVNARAYTVGNDIVFGAGEYSDSGRGRELIAHELTHTLQQSGGTMLRRQKADGKEKEIKEIADTIAGIVKPGMNGFKFKQKWGLVESQIKSPTTTVSKALKDYDGLFAKDLVDKLTALSEEERGLVVTEVRNQVVEGVTGVAGDEIMTEYNSLDSFVRNNIEPGGGKSSFAGYVGARTALMAKFGSVAKINEYYKGLVSADFPSSKVKGYTTKVHANMHAKLQKALTLMKSKKTGTKTWLEIAEEGIKGLGGINIRENRNNTSSLSFHSFGWAIDIDASKNPNIEEKKFPKDLVEGITGENIYTGDDAKAIRKGGTADDLLSHVQAIRDASDTFKGAFNDEASFKSAITTYLSGQGLTVTSTQTGDLYLILTQVSQKKGSTVTVKNVETWLSEAKAKNTPAAPGVAKPTTTPSWEKAATVAAFLVKMYDLFVSSGGKSGKKVDSNVTGSASTIAAHGFLNLPSELVTALISSDGGGLKWLGGIEEGSKDFMHFELKKEDQPTIIKDTPTTGEEKK